MAISLEYPYITRQDGGPARLERHPRVRVAQVVMDHLAHGWSVEEMGRQHPHLSASELHAAMLYYHDHRDEIDAEIREEWDRARREHAEAPRVPFLPRPRVREGS